MKGADREISPLYESHEHYNMSKRAVTPHTPAFFTIQPTVQRGTAAYREARDIASDAPTIAP
jgi:hypothetical protein